jgi:drug/metabolite transporter (DMT)-like permease
VTRGPVGRAELVLLAVTAAWGLTFPAIKIAVAELRPSVFMAARFLLVLVGVFLLYRGRLFRGWRGSVGAGLTLGLLQFASYAFQALGLEHTTATRSAFITGLSVILVPFLYVPIRRRAPGLLPLLGALLALGGLWLMTRPDVGALNRGDLLTLGTAVSYALYVVLLEKFTLEHPVEPLMGQQALVLAVSSLVAMPLLDPHVLTGDFGAPGAGALTGLLVTVPIAMFTIVALTRWQRETTATRASVIYSAEPVFALAFAAVWIGERLDALGLAGAGLILGGILVATVRTGSATAPAS